MMITSDFKQRDKINQWIKDTFKVGQKVILRRKNMTGLSPRGIAKYEAVIGKEGTIVKASLFIIIAEYEDGIQIDMEPIIDTIEIVRDVGE